ncbi:MAG: hypothetical protein AB1714_24410 [Acidobacteriota bacterium]
MRGIDEVDEHLRKLAARARLEPVPHVDVTSNLLALVRERASAVELMERPLRWVAIGSASLAAITAALALRATAQWGDPILNLFCLVTGGIP